MDKVRVTIDEYHSEEFDNITSWTTRDGTLKLYSTIYDYILRSSKTILVAEFNYWVLLERLRLNENLCSSRRV